MKCALTPSCAFILALHEEKANAQKSVVSRGPRQPQTCSLCVFLIFATCHALAATSCAETCLQAFRNRFLSWGALPLDTQERVFSCQASSHIFVTIVVLVVDHLLVRNWSYLFPPLVSASGVFSWRDSVTFASSRPTTKKVSSRKLSICAGNYAQG